MVEMKKVAYVFPGQGSQYVGMGHDLYDGFKSAKALFEQADETLGFLLSRLCFEGPEEELRLTINAQPAIVVASYACLTVAQELGALSKLPQPSFVAGHSLGEYTALAIAGMIDFNTAVYLARERGRLMYESGLERPGSMAAIMGMEENLLAEVCGEAGVKIANINCPGQLVISGPKDSVAQAAELAKAGGAKRAIPLNVSGAFHSDLMKPAVDGMSEIIPSVSFREAAIPVVANTTAKPVTTAEEVKTELLNQLCNCVQWQRSVEYMVKEGVSTFIEIGPGKVLTGLIKRIDGNVETINIGDIKAITELVNR